MDYQNVITERQDHIAKITINRPEKINVLTSQAAKDINDALLELEADNEVYVIVIRGAGRAFCAGIDISEFPNKTALEYHHWLPHFDHFMKNFNFPAYPVC